MQQRVIAIVGPTASGKSSLAIRLAKKIGGEIVSADSRQVYRGLNIGSGKVSQAERRTVPHYLLDVTNPKQSYTVMHFVRDGKRAITTIHNHGNVPMVVGGTGFWIDALLRGIHLPAVPPNRSLRKRLDTYATATLYARLSKLDPARAKTIDRYNRVRLIRALEIVLTTGKPVPKPKHALPYDVLWLGLRPKKKILQKNIHQRLYARFRAGMLAEVRRLLANKVPPKRLLDLGLEYRFVTLYLQKKLTRSEMEKQLEKAIQHYAKRQLTWFKRNNDIQWVLGLADALRKSKHWLQVQT